MDSTLPYFDSLGPISTDAILAKVFPFTTKKRRKSDLLVLENSPSGRVPILCLYVNPHPITEGDKPPHWKRLKIASLKKPIGLAYADISKNGYNDVIVVDEHEPLPSSLGIHFGGRISWFENTGSDDCQWIRREIGKFPGAQIVKVGLFTNNFSPQVLVVPAPEYPSSAPERPCPLAIYTQPPNITTAHQWLSNVTLLSTIHAISDVHVLPSKYISEVELDKMLITSREGISLLWWEMGRWHTRPINPTPIPGPSLVTVGYIDKDLPAYIVSSETLSDRTVLAVHIRPLESRQPILIQQAHWKRYIIDTFPGKKGSTLQISCADFDGDGVEEIMASFKIESNLQVKSAEGIWYYRPTDLANGKFEKYACMYGHFSNFAIGDFRFSGKMDLITTSTPFSSSEKLCRLQHYSNNFKIPVIRASLLQGTFGTLRLSVPNPATFSTSCHELPLFATMATEFTLVMLGPGASYEFKLGMVPECNNRCVKVLHGVLLWNDKSGKTIKRGKAIPFGSRSTTRPLIIEDIRVAAGPTGAIFLTIVKCGSPSRQIVSMIPEPYPSSVRETKSWDLWREDDRARSDIIKVYTFNAFFLYFLGSNESVARVHFTTYSQRAGTTQSSLPAFISRRDLQSNPSVCQVRTCITNHSGYGGVYAEEPNAVPRSAVSSTIYNERFGTRSRRMLVPTMTEVAPEWSVDQNGNPIVVDGRVKYPGESGWVSNVVGEGLGPKYLPNGYRDDDGAPYMDVWMDVDFPPFELEREDNQGKRYGVWVLWIGVSIIISFLLARITLSQLYPQWMGAYPIYLRGWG